jgi:hypothetical protein
MRHGENQNQAAGQHADKGQRASGEHSHAAPPFFWRFGNRHFTERVKRAGAIVNPTSAFGRAPEPDFDAFRRCFFWLIGRRTGIVYRAIRETKWPRQMTHGNPF